MNWLMSGERTIGCGCWNCSWSRSSGGIPWPGGPVGNCGNLKSSVAMGWCSGRLRHDPRAYATALLDTLDFLSEGSVASPLGATAAEPTAFVGKENQDVKELVQGSAADPRSSSASGGPGSRSNGSGIRRRTAEMKEPSRPAADGAKW